MQTQMLTGFVELKPESNPEEFDIDEISKKIDEKMLQTKNALSLLQVSGSKTNDSRNRASKGGSIMV